MCNRYGYGAMGWRSRWQYNAPPVNITETENEYIISLYAPSLAKENIVLGIKDDILSVRYTGAKEEAPNRYIRKEYRVEEIERTFDLRGKVDVDRIRSSYAEGILKIELPKTDAAKRASRELPVE
jgi:HSP20 family protein